MSLHSSKQLGMHKCTCLKDSKSLWALGAPLQGGALPTKWKTGAAPAMNSKQHHFEKVHLGLCVQLWSLGKAPYAVRFLASAGTQRLPGLCSSRGGWGWDSPRSQLRTNTSALPQATCPAALQLQHLPGTLTLSDALVDFYKCLHVWHALHIPKHPISTALGEPSTEKRYILHIFQPLQKLSEKSQRRKLKRSFTSTSCSCQLEEEGQDREQHWKAPGWDAECQTPFAPPARARSGRPARAA